MYRVFISHCYSDAQFARQLASDLRESWLDEQAVFCDNQVNLGDLAGSESPLTADVQEALTRSTFFLVILSRDALNSEPLKREIQLAFQQRKETIIGLQREICSVPLALQNQPIISFMPPVEYDDGLAELHGLLLEAMEGPKQKGISVNSGGSVAHYRVPTGRGKTMPAMLLPLISPAVLARVVDASQSPNCMIEEYLKDLQGQGSDQQTCRVYEAGMPDFAASDPDRQWLEVPDRLHLYREHQLGDEEPPQPVAAPQRGFNSHQIAFNMLKALFACLLRIRSLLASIRRSSARLGSVIQDIAAKIPRRAMSSLAASIVACAEHGVQAAHTLSSAYTLLRNVGRAMQQILLLRTYGSEHTAVRLDSALYPGTWDSYLAWLCESQRQDPGAPYGAMALTPRTTASQFPAFAKWIESTALRVSRHGSTRATRVVLAIGVGTYDNSHLPDLPASVRMAESIYHSCSYHWSATNAASRNRDTRVVIQLLTDRKASAQSIRDALRNLASQCHPDDTVAVYFAGHGRYEATDDRAQDYLCLSDTDPQDLRRTALSREELLSSLSGIGSRRVLLCLDTCRSARSADSTWEPRGLEQFTASRCELVSEFFETCEEALGGVVVDPAE